MAAMLVESMPSLAALMTSNCTGNWLADAAPEIDVVGLADDSTAADRVPELKAVHVFIEVDGAPRRLHRSGPAVGVPAGLIDGVSAHQAIADRHQGIFPGAAQSLPA